jgi:glycosyltransferase involved in cell wall biosynthesis
MPSHNSERYVGEAIASILAERDVLLEVIVIDDHSTDGSRRKVLDIGDPRVRLIDSTGRGIAATLNAGLAAANGEFIMRCDSDDLYPDGRIKQQVDWLQRHPDFDAVCGSFTTIDAGGRIVLHMPSGADPAEITDELRAGRSRTHLCTFAIRSALAQRTAGFRAYFEMGEDLDYQYRLAEFGRIAYVPDSWYFYRIHASSITHVQKDERRLFFENAAREFAIQRRHGGPDALQEGRASVPPKLQRAAVNSSGQHLQGILLGRAWTEFESATDFRSAPTALRAMLADPLSLNGWRSGMTLLLRLLLRAVGAGQRSR